MNVVCVIKASIVAIAGLPSGTSCAVLLDHQMAGHELVRACAHLSIAILLSAM